VKVSIALSLRRLQGDTAMAFRTYDPRSLARVEFILKRQIDIAAQEHYKAKVEFWQITETPGLTDERKLNDCERKCAVAQNALTLALQRFNGLMVAAKVKNQDS
jgi:hypothetical protein